IKTGIFIFATCLLNNCKRDFLEKYQLDQISNATFWHTENDLMIYNNGLYNMARKSQNVPILLGTDDGFESKWCASWYLDQYSDNIAPTHSREAFYAQTRSGKHSVPSSPQQYGWVGWDFVRAINVGLDHYFTADIPVETINKYAAEARLFRGWF